MAVVKMRFKLGVKMHDAAQKALEDFEKKITDIYSWIDEYISDAKNTFNT